MPQATKILLTKECFHQENRKMIFRIAGLFITHFVATTAGMITILQFYG